MKMVMEIVEIVEIVEERGEAYRGFLVSHQESA